MGRCQEQVVAPFTQSLRSKIRKITWSTYTSSLLEIFRRQSMTCAPQSLDASGGLALFLTAILLLYLLACLGVSHNSSPAQPQAPSTLSYADGTAVYTQRLPITVNHPASTGGAVTSYSVTPPLPAGIVLNTSTGVVSGTPTPSLHSPIRTSAVSIRRFPTTTATKSGSGTSTRNYANGRLANLSLVRLMHNHTGNFGTSIDLVNTPDRDQTDNDYAVGSDGKNRS